MGEAPNSGILKFGYKVAAVFAEFVAFHVIGARTGNILDKLLCINGVLLEKRTELGGLKFEALEDSNLLTE